MTSQSELPALPLWVEFFEDLKLRRGRSLNTIMAYRRDLELWEAYLAQNLKAKPLSTVNYLGHQEEVAKHFDGIDVPKFFAYMKAQGLSVRSQARVISSIRTYYRFIEESGHRAPILQELHPPKVKAALPKLVTEVEFEKLMSAAFVEGDEARTSRNRITLLMLFGLGCRVSELISVNLNDFHAQDQWLSVIGKGNKERPLPLTSTLTAALTHYLTYARPQLLKGEKSEHSILINDRGRRPSRIDIWRWLAAWSERAGFSEAVSPHRFRHGCATALLEAGADLRSIQTLLGHASIQTTQIYTSVTAKNLKETIDQHHPLSGVEVRKPLDH